MDRLCARIFVRMGGSVYLAGGDSLEASIQTRAPVEFTIRWDKDYVKVIAGGSAMGDLAVEIACIPRSRLPGQPGLLRVGKMPNSAGPADHEKRGLTVLTGSNGSAFMVAVDAACCSGPGNLQMTASGLQQ